MVAVTRNLEKNHQLDTFVYDYRGDRNIVVTKTKPKGDVLVDFWVHRLSDVAKRLMKEASPIERCKLKEFGAEQPTDFEKFVYVQKIEPDVTKRFEMLHPSYTSSLNSKTNTQKLADILKIDVNQ
jgi:hypothetical protein